MACYRDNVILEDLLQKELKLIIKGDEFLPQDIDSEQEYIMDLIEIRNGVKSEMKDYLGFAGAMDILMKSPRIKGRE